MFERVFELYIVFTRNCNLRCSYCYQAKSDKNITKETIDRIIDFIIDNPKINYINLFGGEAFTQLEMIDYFIDELIKVKNNFHREFNLYSNTNGTIYNDKFINIINKISNNFLFRYAVSIDGNKQFHDSKRKTTSGKPTYDLIINNIKKIRLNSPKTHIDFHTVIQNEMCNDFYKIAKEICRNPLFEWGAFEFLMKIDGKCHYTLKEMENIYSGIMKLNKEGYSLEFLQVRFNNLLKSIDYRYNNFLKEKEFCPNGQTTLAIDYDGRAYPCDFYLTLDREEQDKYYIYDLKTKKYRDNYNRLLNAIKETDEEKERCIDCKAKQFCYICTGVKEIHPNCGLDIECQQNKLIYQALQNIKFIIE